MIMKGDIMKRLKKVLAVSLTIFTIAFLFAGCGSSASAKANQTQANGNFHGRGSFSPSAIKTRYEAALKELVSSKTITQAQADKVLNALTSNVRKNTTGETNKNQQNGQNNSQGSRQNKSRYNPLSSLVSSKVITQAQSDAIMQKIRGNHQNFPNQQNSQTTQNLN